MQVPSQIGKINASLIFEAKNTELATLQLLIVAGLVPRLPNPFSVKNLGIGPGNEVNIRTYVIVADGC